MDNEPNIKLIESIQRKITEINDDLRAVCGTSANLIKCKTNALETIDIFDTVDVCNLLAAIKKDCSASYCDQRNSSCKTGV